jgi:hypothetical protein
VLLRSAGAQKRGRVKLLKTLITVSSLLFASTIPLVAQQDSGSDLQGLNGKVSIIPSASLRQTTIAFTSSVPLNSTSKQIVFVVQMPEGTAFPSAWSGQAKVLSGQGVLVVSPVANNGTSSNSGMLFKFAEKAIPPSLKGWSLSSFAVYGIARYGETIPLSEAQIEALATTGKYTSEKSSLNLTMSLRSVLPDETDPHPPICSAGGPGSDCL